MSILQKVKRKFVQEFKTRVVRDPFYLAVQRWFQDKGDETLRLNYELNENSVVLDVGGFEGAWANSIHSKYLSTVHIFEPVHSFYEVIQARFKGNGKIRAYEFGLSDAEKKLSISLQADGSSTIRQESSDLEEVRLRDIVTFFKENSIEEVDLIKINIEGGEYELLERMLEADLVTRCKNLQIQFHDFFPEAKKMRDEIRKKLTRTHRITYDYYFVWENWERK